VKIFLHIFFTLILINQVAFSGEGKAYKHKAIPENSDCFRCHGNKTYIAYSSDSSQTMTMPMSYNRRIDTALYMNSVHGGFACTDCHSQEYQTCPHPADAKFETIYGCLDCHGGNEKFAKYHFEDIDAEYQKSVHATKMSSFTCWKCHNPHEYTNVFVSTQNIKESVKVSNKACLACHNNPETYNLYESEKMKDIAKEHEWLPEQELHFNHVRCIDCHSTLQDSIATPHNIMTSNKAIKDCKVCHSDESRLTASLYKYKMKENRKTYGFVNAAVVNDAYVIGANRNRFLNIASVVIFSLVAFAILAHIMLRIIIKKSKDNG